jgi:hypothetical protein
MREGTCFTAFLMVATDYNGAAEGVCSVPLTSPRPLLTWAWIACRTRHSSTCRDNTGMLMRWGSRRLKPSPGQGWGVPTRTSRSMYWSSCLSSRFTRAFSSGVSAIGLCMARGE